MLETAYESFPADHRDKALHPVPCKTLKYKGFCSIKNDTVIDTIVSITVSVMVAGIGFEPTTSGL